MIFDMNLSLPELVEAYDHYVVIYIPEGSCTVSTSVLMIL